MTKKGKLSTGEKCILFKSAFHQIFKNLRAVSNIKGAVTKSMRYIGNIY